MILFLLNTVSGLGGTKRISLPVRPSAYSRTQQTDASFAPLLPTRSIEDEPACANIYTAGCRRQTPFAPGLCLRVVEGGRPYTVQQRVRGRPCAWVDCFVFGCRSLNLWLGRCGGPGRAHEKKTPPKSEREEQEADYSIPAGACRPSVK